MYVCTATRNFGRDSDTFVDSLDIINIKLVLLVIIVVLVVELEVALILISALVGIVDLGRLGELTLGLESSGLVGVVLHDDIGLVVLEISERKQNDISLVDPDLLSELSSDVSKSSDTVKALGLDSAVTKHLCDLGILLALLLEHKLSLAALVLVLSSSSVLASLELVKFNTRFELVSITCHCASSRFAVRSTRYSPFPCS